MSPRRARLRLGLRTRLTVMFGVGGLLLAVFLAALTYSLARGYLLRQREASTLRNARANAEAVAARLRSADDLPGILDTASRRSGSEALVLLDGQLFGSSVTDTPARLPDRFVAAVESGQAVRQRLRGPDAPRLAVGIPLPQEGAGYIEVFSLVELDRTLRALARALLAAAAVTCLGFATLGWFASRRVLTPVTDVSRAASAIAEGALGTRLDVGADPSLRPLADSFNAMADALQRRIERDARFTADVSHELRSPLTALAASFSVLESHRDEMSERPQRAVGLHAHEIDRFTRLVEDLLEISRSDAGTPIEREEVAVDDLVRQTVARSVRPDVPVDVDSGEPLVVLGDKRRLDRVLVNLLENAEQHAGGAVRVGVHRTGDTVRIEVDDAGLGIPAAERSRVFERFARGRAGADRRHGRGAGLGLALVHEHVRAHGGHAGVEDRPGGGARFVVDLPAAAR